MRRVMGNRSIFPTTQMQNTRGDVLHPCCMEKIASFRNSLKCLDFIVTHGIVVCGQIYPIEQN